MQQSMLICLVAAGIGLSACKQGFQPVKYGYDACTHCKMTVMDKRFAAEIVTKKGRAYVFDDMACLLSYMKAAENGRDIAGVFVSNYNNPEGKFLDAYQAVYFRGEAFKSPMNGNYAAFAPGNAATPAGGGLQEGPLKWNDLQSTKH
jgi:copper chaperone NosL